MTDLPRTRSAVPDPTLLLFLMAAGLAATLLTSDPTTRIVLAVVALLPLAIWFVVRLASNAQTGVALLVVASAVPRGAVNVGGMNVRPEHLAVGLVGLALPLLLRRHPRQAPWIYADYLLAAYVAANLLSSLVMSPAPTQTLKWSLQQTLAILPYFFLRMTAGDERGFRWAFRVFLLVGALAAAYGVVAYYSNFLFGTEFGVDVEQYAGVPATYGTQFEANILGAYCGAGAVAMLAMYLQERRRIFLLGYGITLTGMAVSLSRAAVGATLVGLLVLAWFARPRKLINRRTAAATLLATMCVTVVSLPVLASQYSERFSTLEVSDPTADPNTMFRVAQFAVAVDDILASPVLGNGTASFQLLYDRQLSDFDIGDQVPWIANSELRILHDTGAIGLLVFLLFALLLLRRAWPVLKQGAHPAMMALLASLAVYCVSFQATEGTLLAFTWVHLGLLGCLAAMAHPGNRRALPAETNGL